jgi:hypothetical protein
MTRGFFATSAARSRGINGIAVLAAAKVAPRMNWRRDNSVRDFMTRPQQFQGTPPHNDHFAEAQKPAT